MGKKENRNLDFNQGETKPEQKNDTATNQEPELGNHPAGKNYT